MSLSSMTGFARAAAMAGAARIVWELKSVNGKTLDVRLRTPPGFDDLAEEARRRIAPRFRRGTCFASLTIQRDERPPVVTINENVLAQLVALSARYAGRDGVAAPTLDGLLAVRGVVEVSEGRDDEAAEAALRGAIAQALDAAIVDLAAARNAEGAALEAILSQRLSDIERLTEAAEHSPGRQPAAIRKRLAEQVAALLDSGRELDPVRLHQEAALLATRADIREEIDRLRAHAVAARTLIGEGGSIGRKLDFLAQEMGREANTLSAKANDIALNAIGLELKSVVEQLREQVQNVE